MHRQATGKALAVAVPERGRPTSTSHRHAQLHSRTVAKPFQWQVR